MTPLLSSHESEKSSTKKDMHLISFQSAIAERLCQAGETSSGAARSRRRPSSQTPVAMPSKRRKSSSVPNPVEDVRLDQCSHFPIYEEKQQRCRLCNTGYSHFKCAIFMYTSQCLIKSRNCLLVSMDCKSTVLCN